MPRSRLERLAPLTGVVFFLMGTALFVLGGSTPDAGDKPAKVIRYWHNHQDRVTVTSIVGCFAALFLLWFAGSLRAAIAEAEGPPARLANTAFAGAIVLAMAILIGSSLDFTLADSVDDVPPVVTQTISAIDSDFFFPFLVGGGLLLVASGLAAIRTRMLPRWLAWLTLVLGVVNFTPVGFFAFLLGFLWVGVMGVLLFVRGGRPAAPTAPATSPGSPA